MVETSVRGFVTMESVLESLRRPVASYVGTLDRCQKIGYWKRDRRYEMQIKILVDWGQASVRVSARTPLSRPSFRVVHRGGTRVKVDREGFTTPISSSRVVQKNKTGVPTHSTRETNQLSRRALAFAGRTRPGLQRAPLQRERRPVRNPL